MRTRLLLLVACGVAPSLQAAPPSAASDQPVAALQRPTPLREYRGLVVYSDFDPATSRYRLAVREPDGSTTFPSIAPSGLPFTADIGPDSRGRPELIYSRCATAGGLPSNGNPPPGGCDLFVYSLARATGERAVGNANTTDSSETAPTLWKGRIAFTRYYADGQPVVYTKELVAPRSRPSRRLPGVPQRRCGRYVDGKGCVQTRMRRVELLELYGRRLAEVVRYAATGAGGFSQTEVRLADLGDGSARQVAYKSSGMGGQTLLGPSFESGRLYWYLACLGDPFGCHATDSGVFRYRISTRDFGLAGRGVAQGSFAIRTSSSAYVGPSPDACGVSSQGLYNGRGRCAIELLDGLRFQPERDQGGP